MTFPSRPAPFSAFTTPEFWDDPHISRRMLAEHLDPDAPMASRRHDFIDQSVDWLVPALGLVPGSRVLDLGCGPGLYAERLARRGIEVLGIDVSRASVAHAQQTAERESLPVTLRRGDYLEADLGTDHDAALLIYEDYCALSPRQRALLLSRVHAALKPGGRFLFDVTSAARFGEVVLDRYTIRTDASTSRFWNWMHCLTPDEVAAELRAAGFTETRFYGDVAGRAYDSSLPTFAVLSKNFVLTE